MFKTVPRLYQVFYELISIGFKNTRGNSGGGLPPPALRRFTAVLYRYVRVCRWVWADGCEVRPCGTACVPAPPPPMSFYRYVPITMSLRWYRFVPLLADLGSMKVVAGNAYTESAKCPFMNYLLDHATSKQGIVLDVGANGGCEMTTALRKGRRVIGVECLESAYRELLNMSHIMENPNATLLHVCASNSTRMAELNLAGDSSSLIEANVAKGWELKKVPKHGRVREPVILLPLDKLLPPAECVAVIKVDVQGAEYEALQGLLNTIIRDRPVIGYEDETRFVKGGNVNHMLERLGYTCHGYGNPQHNREGNTICTPSLH